MNSRLNEGALWIIQQLIHQGYAAYLVGGCVRDRQLQRPVKDYDIATSALPEQVVALFARTIPTGLQHGTVSVIVDGELYEVTTFRKESAYEQFRRPTEVQFIDSLHEDLQRRDFTMNAMALNADGELIDPFGGMADLNRGVLRCVGDATERFREDALRMLRCIRFSAEYALRIEQETWQALCRNASLLKHIAIERVRMELERMIDGANPIQAIHLLSSSCILEASKHPLKLAQLDRVQLSSQIQQLSAPMERWSYLYLAMGLGVQETEAEMRTLTFSRQQLRIVCNVVGAAYMLAEASSLCVGACSIEARQAGLRRTWKLTALQYGRESVQTIGNVLSMDPKALTLLGITEQTSAVFLEYGDCWLHELVISSLDQLQVGGKELLAHIRQAPGSWIAEVLNSLFQAVALGGLPNEPAVLLAEAQRLVENSNR